MLGADPRRTWRKQTERNHHSSWQPTRTWLSARQCSLMRDGCEIAGFWSIAPPLPNAARPVPGPIHRKGWLVSHRADSPTRHAGSAARTRISAQQPLRHLQNPHFLRPTLTTPTTTARSLHLGWLTFRQHNSRPLLLRAYLIIRCTSQSHPCRGQGTLENNSTTVRHVRSLASLPHSQPVSIHPWAGIVA